MTYMTTIISMSHGRQEEEGRLAAAVLWYRLCRVLLLCCSRLMLTCPATPCHVQLCRDMLQNCEEAKRVRQTAWDGKNPISVTAAIIYTVVQLFPVSLGF